MHLLTNLVLSSNKKSNFVDFAKNRFSLVLFSIQFSLGNQWVFIEHSNTTPQGFYSAKNSEVLLRFKLRRPACRGSASGASSSDITRCKHSIFQFFHNSVQHRCPHTFTSFTTGDHLGSEREREGDAKMSAGYQ